MRDQTLDQSQDYYVAVPLQIQKLYARQDAENTEHHELAEIMTWAKEKHVSRDIVNPSQIPVKMPSIKRGGKKSTRQKLTVPLHTFKRENGSLIVPIGGHYGIFKQAIHRIGKAKKGNYYKAEQWDLVYAYAIDGTDDAKLNVKDLIKEKAKTTEVTTAIEVFLGKINRSGQDAAYVQFAWQRLNDITIPVVLEINRICPLPLQEIKDTLHGLKTIPFGPNKHGRCMVNDSLVKEFATFDEAAKYLESLKN